jgi:hypothetical protein
MAKFIANPAVLVLGDHPAAYLTAALLRERWKQTVLHATIPGEDWPDRLVIINPQFFDLHALVHPLARKLDLRAVYGTRFLADDAAVRSEHHSKSAMASVGSFRQVRDALRAVAADRGVELVASKSLRIHRLDEHGLEVTINGSPVRPRGLALAGRLEPAQERLLGLPEIWDHGIVHRYSFVKVRGIRSADLGSRPLVPMSLDLRGRLFWGWLLAGPRHVELAVEQPIETLTQTPPGDLLSHWLSVLKRHAVVGDQTHAVLNDARWLDMPLGGALAHEGVANRTVLVGPAGGFYTTSAEDIYPTCWSALFAAEALGRSLREKHLQDALQLYRHKWRTTLGQYLRGPQQNLRFLLPLIYRNQVMATRLAEAILVGKSVVR